MPGERSMCPGPGAAWRRPSSRRGRPASPTRAGGSRVVGATSARASWLRGLAAFVVVGLVGGCAAGATPSPPALAGAAAAAPPTSAVTPPATPAPTVAATPLPATGSPLPTGSPPSAFGLPADDGARIVAVAMVDARIRDLTIVSPALGAFAPANGPYGRTATVRLLLPSDFDARPAARWPVLYLLCGAGGDHTEWTQNTDVEKATAPTDLLVVLPDAGGGWYSNWWNGGKGGPPEWETFHLVELRQLLERNWRAGDRRVIAGQSMGGYGAMEYASRGRGMFLAAASFSGVLDPAAEAARGWSIGAPTAMWGNPFAQAAVWQARDPTDHPSALAGTALYVAYGNGRPGSLDASGAAPDPQEAEVATESAAFVRALGARRIPATVDAYGNGTHGWPYWQRDLHRWLPLALQALGE